LPKTQLDFPISAIEQEKISLGRGAEVLGLSLQDMRDLTAAWVG
jgi:predicted HTH domain antitoxin